MKASIFAFLLFIGQASANDFCNEKLRTRVTEAEELKNGTLLTTTDGDQYPNGTFWKKEEGSWWACPCLLHPCIRVCDPDIIQGFSEDVPAPIPWDEIYANKSATRGRYKYVHEAMCEDLAYFLDKGRFKILDNGELELEGEDENLDATHYCVHHVGEYTAHVMHCIEPEEYYPPFKFNLYPPFFILSSIFLILTILAFALTPEIKSFHTKCVVCHSACLAVAFIALTVNYLRGDSTERVLCFTIGYTALYSFHASMFWLNSMCIDIFLTFKGVVRTQGIHFVKFTVYSFGTPMVITIVALIFNVIHDEDSIFNSRLGENSCWMEDGIYAMWIFFLGPTLMLLMANLALFTATVFNVTRTRRESVRALKKTNSKVHMSRRQANQRRGLYVKLSVLVGFPWIIEVLHSIVSGADVYCFVSSENYCIEDLRSKVTNATVLGNGTLLTSDGVHHPENTFWQKDEHWWVCPCLAGVCIRKCSNEFAEELGLTLEEETARIPIWDRDRVTHASLEKAFRVAYNHSCDVGIPLRNKNSFRILANGSLHAAHLQDSPFNVNRFCVFPLGNDEIAAVVCLLQEHYSVVHIEQYSTLKYKLYPPFFILSSIFLIFTVVAFMATPENKTFHAKSVVCHSGCLSIAFLGLSIIYLAGPSLRNTRICSVIVYVTKYFIMTAVFWLNAMCIDIYFAFKGLVRSSMSHLKFSIYAWTSPLIIETISVILDLTTSHPKFSPGIGKEKCWISSYWGELLYFQGPIFILLVANVGLFCATACNVRRSMRESFRTLNRANSKVHLHKRHDRQRLCLYLKLSLLMGFTWLTEVISWAVGGPPEYWYFTDVVNALRGVFIFWIFVFSNKKMRRNLRERMQKGKFDVSTSANLSEQQTSASTAF
ncbi:Hypothetical predicted protein [Cloeon dipterum]|uniref:G-protein coupled receptors family 2 profile 2 domain-containing protein n=1 Tax=Cloeon dipterum TaxID=197152 RepID=A0A8S1DYN2_9INSE|nr:Hypothetical predicted protein [Cloeon dipterum]